MKYPALKSLLTRVGGWVPPKVVHNFNGVLNYLSVGRWFKERGLRIPFQSDARTDLYRHVASLISEPATYLEFGVFQGEALRFWLGLLKHPDSRFHGFDSFEGLPEKWTHLYDKGAFDVGGRMPVFEDQRVHLHKGWFSDTLPGFCKTFTSAPQLIIHLDADLYSSTIFVLRELKSFIRPGTVLLFDEFFDRDHELKAFTEFMEDQKLAVECLGTTHAHVQAAFRVLPSP
jgi:O-methyltransferase